MRTEATKSERDTQAAYEKQITKLACVARKFVATYDEFFPEYPYALGDNTQALIEAADSVGGGDVGDITLALWVIDADAETYGVAVLDKRGFFRWWLGSQLTLEGASATLLEAESFFASIGLTVRLEKPFSEPTASGSAAQAALDSNAEHGRREALNPLPQNEEQS